MIEENIFSIACLCALWITVNFVILFVLKPWEWEDYINPYYIYQVRDVNWIGCAILTLLGNALLPIVSVCYWIYFICTVGR